MTPKAPDSKPVDVAPRLLSSWPLPTPRADGESEGRGHVLVVGGAADMPGTVILAATAALRAGAGNVRIATGYSARILVMAAIPEARVFALQEDKRGHIVSESVDQIVTQANESDALLVGPGFVDWETLSSLLQHVLISLYRPALILDAAALAVAAAGPDFLSRFAGNVILIAHSEELGRLLGISSASVRERPSECALFAARQYHGVVILKGQRGWVAAPDGRVFRGPVTSPGLSTRGAADVLAGIVAGLVGRGADPVQAAVWAIALHARAGDVLARRLGPIGFLAHELPPEIPRLLVAFAHSPPSGE